MNLLAFRKELDWEHPPYGGLRTLSTSIALEAAELMEHSQWAKDADLPAIAAERREALAEEIADVAILLTYLAHDLDVDMEEAVRRKLLKMFHPASAGTPPSTPWRKRGVWRLSMIG